MARKIIRSSTKAGLEPGTMVHVGEQKQSQSLIRFIHYTETQYQERKLSDFNQCAAFLGQPGVTWINIDGVHEVGLLEQLGQCFGIHPLVLEDIVHTDQRPKFEDHGDYLFTTFKSFDFVDGGQIVADQVSIVFGKNYVLTFLERTADEFEPVRKRLENATGKMRKLGPDFLAYSLMDAVVDRYFIVLESTEERMEALEEEVYERPTQQTLQDLHSFKRDLVFLRKWVWPLREVIAAMDRSGSEHIKKNTSIYLRDLHDHSIRIVDSVENLKENVTSLFDLYLSSVSNRLNGVMKVLTIISTIFIPLSFFAGVYGMNFEFFPEIHWRYGYVFFWSVIITAVATMLTLFHRKRWF
jgi:magnesium transporter